MKPIYNLKNLLKAKEGDQVLVRGWVHHVRNLGNLVFVNLRDQYGLLQVVLDAEQAKDLNLETVIEVEGILKNRENPHAKLLIDNWEIKATKIKIISKAKTLPFVIGNELKANEETRLKYRYLDLRRPLVKERILARSKMNQIIRLFLDKQDFLEIETPILTRSTPEGARDYLVPSRLKSHHFYALPQSPQLFKQLLMIANFDRYFQITRSFRDEDLRLDRQPEFSQLDVEMSFANPEDVMNIITKLIKKIFQEMKPKKTSLSFQKITYNQAINKYGTDKPDLRFNLPIIDIGNISTLIDESKDMKQFKHVTKAIIVPKVLTHKEINHLEELAIEHYHLSKLYNLKYKGNHLSGSLVSSLTKEEKARLLRKTSKNESGTILIAHGPENRTLPALGLIRNNLGRMLSLIDDNQFKALWVVDFPLFEWSEAENRYVSAHNPFTMPHTNSLKTFDTDFKNSKAQSFDLVINGYEIGSGAQRISDPKLQKRMLKALKIDSKEIKNNFEWFIKAYEFGAPYHSGIGLGLDRLAMILLNSNSIRDVIAFPKNSAGYDLMMESPTKIKDNQLKELKIKLTK